MAGEGFTAGLKFWLVFLLAFFLLGYSALLSIALGALGGIAGGFVISWWQTIEPVANQRPAESIEEKAEPDQGRDRSAPQWRSRSRAPQPTSRFVPGWFRSRRRRRLVNTRR